jgi:hypothetical protein
VVQVRYIRNTQVKKIEEENRPPARQTTRHHDCIKQKENTNLVRSFSTRLEMRYGTDCTVSAQRRDTRC